MKTKCKKCGQPLLENEMDEGICNGCDSDELVKEILEHRKEDMC